MFDDFKANIQVYHERQVAEAFLAKAQPITQPTEQAVITKALNLPTQNLKRFQYTTDKNLATQIEAIYPEATNIIIVNNDTRDGLGIPKITTWQLRSRVGRVTWSQGSRVIHNLNYDAYKILLCLVENGVVNVKVVTKGEIT
jgi:hypothetical protein